MNTYSLHFRQFTWPTVTLLLAALTAGCTRTEAPFRQNVVYRLKMERESKEEFSAQRQADLDAILAGLFGTPDQPNVPKLGDVEVDKVLDVNKIRFASGAVGSDESGRAQGLYREHCAHCHGITGDGAGPTASFLNPYPRDYRMGVFKFKSTPKGMRPTHADLQRILLDGVPGTAMPSFLVLPENEIEALIHYVRYLSIRGEVERSLIFYAMTELEPEDRLLNIGGTQQVQADQASTIRDFTAEVVQKWLDADSVATPVVAPDPQRNLKESIRHGRELFYGPVANCVKCHGNLALGDGQTTDYDDWAKELDPTNPEVLKEYLALGSFVLKPRTILPRNLRQGIYRGGRRPLDMYWRIHNGIDGTPMPGALLLKEDSPPGAKGLTQEDVWALVDYVQSLPYESISRPPVINDAYQRERL